MAATSFDEDIIRKRLTANTIQTGRGDYPFRTLAKLYNKMAAAALQGTAEQASAAHGELVRELFAMDLAARKGAAAADASRREQAAYAARQTEIQNSTEQAHKDIARRKEELAAARLQKKRNEEYESLRRDCMKHAKRSTTAANIERIKAEIVEVDAESRRATEDINRQRQQFAAFLEHMDQLRQGQEAEDGASDGAVVPMQS